MPLPNHISELKVIETISPKKDVDGFHPLNSGKLVQGHPTFAPATPYGMTMLMEYFNIETKGKNAVVIGRSNIVGRPLSILMSFSWFGCWCHEPVTHQYAPVKRGYPRSALW